MTGSNAVNVFLGIGVAWTVAAIVHWSKNEKFHVDPGKYVYFKYYYIYNIFLEDGKLSIVRNIKKVTSRLTLHKKCHRRFALGVDYVKFIIVIYK